ncbi:hypothetical protein [Pseudobutyrivibrio sp.]
MRILVGEKMYDSTEQPVLLIFDENEKEIFNGYSRYVSAPQDSTVEERQRLIDLEI